MRPFLFIHSWPSALKYIKHFTNINSVINYFYLQSLTIQKHFFLFFDSGGKDNFLKEFILVRCFIYFKADSQE